MKRMSKTMTFCVMAGVALTALSACNTFNRPHFFPTGYVFHGESYKSAPPGESTRFTQAQRSTMTAEQADQFRLSIYALVESLTLRAGMPPKAVYVVQVEPMTPFYARLDNDLRESLRHMGYTLADTPDNAYGFTYTAEILTEEKPQILSSSAKDTAEVDSPVKEPMDVAQSAQADAIGAPNVRLAIQVFDKVGEDATMLTQESSDVFIDGAETLSLPFASFPGTFIPEPTGPGGNFRE
jgi:hypothetical protein